MAISSSVVLFGYRLETEHRLVVFTCLSFAGHATPITTFAIYVVNWSQLTAIKFFWTFAMVHIASYLQHCTFSIVLKITYCTRHISLGVGGRVV